MVKLLLKFKAEVGVYRITFSVLTTILINNLHDIMLWHIIKNVSWRLLIKYTGKNNTICLTFSDPGLKGVQFSTDITIERISPGKTFRSNLKYVNAMHFANLWMALLRKFESLFTSLRIDLCRSRDKSNSWVSDINLQQKLIAKLL